MTRNRSAIEIKETDRQTKRKRGKTEVEESSVQSWSFFFPLATSLIVVVLHTREHTHAHTLHAPLAAVKTKALKVR